MNRPLFRTGLAAAAGLAVLAAPAVAQTPGKFRMTLNYDGKLVVKVLDVTITQTADDNGYSSTAHLTSYGVLAAFKKINQTATARGSIDRGVARPVSFSHRNQANPKGRKIDVRWTGGNVVTTAVPAYGNMGSPPATLAQKLEAVDPVTGLMRLALSDRQAQLCVGTLKFFDGKQRYDLTFSGRSPATPTAREKRLGLINPVRCNVVYREVAGFKKKPPEKRNQGLNKPIAMTFAQVGAGGPWVISSMTGQTPLGNAVIELARVSTSGATPEN
ncbi:MAG: DUF3108 domain-containing protein [Caulobacteraceae bacterium]|nr:DUF3108 domain-containing protein [Caulobacteraceae bacterium]